MRFLLDVNALIPRNACNDETGTLAYSDFRFQSVAALPAWVKKPALITNGHLLTLAKSILATCEEGIPGAFLIP